MDTTTLAILIVIVAAAGLFAFIFWQRQRRRRLQQQFGPEYSRTLDEVGNRTKAEKELEERKKRVESFSLHTLKPEERLQFTNRWTETQNLFVDDPSGAVEQADQLVQQVMMARGYPMANFEQRAADISVDHPHVVRNYRAARDIAERNRSRQANTEDLRQAVVYYRELFEDLLEIREPVSVKKLKSDKRDYDERQSQRVR